MIQRLAGGEAGAAFGKSSSRFPLMPEKTGQLKKAAGERAVDFVRPGMTVGLGTGSTAEFAIEEMSRRMRDGRLSDVTCVPSSLRTERFAGKLGLRLVGLASAAKIDVTIDGADEIDSDFNLIKGGGGALLREKVLAQNSERNIVVADESKLSRRLGSRFPVPVEVVEFALEAEKAYLESQGGEAALRAAEDGSAFLTDQGNFIIDWRFGEIEDPGRLAGRLSARAGVMEHGLFVGTASDLVIGFQGRVEHLSSGETAETMRLFEISDS